MLEPISEKQKYKKSLEKANKKGRNALNGGDLYSLEFKQLLRLTCGLLSQVRYGIISISR